MTLVLIGNAVVGFVVLIAMVRLLAGSIARSHSYDQQAARAARAAARRQKAQDRARPSSAPRRSAGWAARPDAF